MEKERKAHRGHAGRRIACIFLLAVSSTRPTTSFFFFLFSFSFPPSYHSMFYFLGVAVCQYNLALKNYFRKNHRHLRPTPVITDMLWSHQLPWGVLSSLDVARPLPFKQTQLTWKSPGYSPLEGSLEKSFPYIPYPVLIPCSPHTCDMFWSHQLPGVPSSLGLYLLFVFNKHSPMGKKTIPFVLVRALTTCP